MSNDCAEYKTSWYILHTDMSPTISPMQSYAPAILLNISRQVISFTNYIKLYNIKQ